ncbi:MAG: alpha-L-fucosidase [Bacilli bacterium]|nr:alpha-L-fucosidase [Bacilli bacterium]
MKTDFLYQAKYGLFIHWTSFSLNKSDKEEMSSDFEKRFESYKRAVEEFDVATFVEQVKETGAGFVIMTLNHADFVLPFPLKEMDELLPKRKIKRDLLQEIIEGMNENNIKFIAYFNGDGFADKEWQELTGFYSDPKGHAEYCYKITKAISDKYGKGISGWWIDGCYLIEYNNRSGERYDYRRYKKCLLSGNEDAIVAFNLNGTEEWKFETEEGVSDYQAGELVYLDRYPAGRFSGEAKSQWFSCCYMDDNWVHSSPGKVVSRFSDEEVIDYIKKVNEKGGTFAYNCALYRNGHFPKAEIIQLNKIKEALKWQRIIEQRAHKMSRVQDMAKGLSP